MGDKSPKSRQKSSKQKQVKTDAIAVEKQRVIDLKSVPSAAGSKKKK